MDTNLTTDVPVARSEAQAEASRLNGARSLGPVTEAGKKSSAANGIVHGVMSSSVLLPSETREQYEANLSDWTATLRPASPGEGQCVARVADLSFRLGRLQRLEDRHQAASLEVRVQETKACKQLKAAKNARTAFKVMAETLSALTEAMPAEAVKGLVSPIDGAVAMLEPLELPAEITVPLEAAKKKLEEEVDGLEVAAEVFRGLVEAGEEVLQALDAKEAELEAQLEVERESLADQLLLGEDRELKRFTRQRNALSKALDSELARLRLIRELAAASSGLSGTAFGPLLIELRVVGRREA